MRTMFVPIALALLGSTVAAHDEKDPWYVQFGLGALFSDKAEDVPGGNIEFDPGYALSLGFGYRICQGEHFGFDAQLEALYTDFKVDEGDLNAIASAIDDDAGALAWMVNGIAEWYFTRQFAIYGGVGVGWASSIEYDAWDSGNLNVEDDSGLAFQGMFGFLYNLGGTYDVMLGYRYFRTESIEIDDLTPGEPSSDIEVGQHIAEIVLRWGL